MPLASPASSNPPSFQSPPRVTNTASVVRHPWIHFASCVIKERADIKEYKPQVVNATKSGLARASLASQAESGTAYSVTRIIASS